MLTDEQRKLFRPVAVELKAGEASFHHPRTLHGSYPNHAARPRRATVVNVFRDGVRSNSDEPLLDGVPVIPTGEPMGGQFFPLLFDPSATGFERRAWRARRARRIMWRILFGKLKSVRDE